MSMVRMPYLFFRDSMSSGPLRVFAPPAPFKERQQLFPYGVQVQIFGVKTAFRHDHDVQGNLDFVLVQPEKFPYQALDAVPQNSAPQLSGHRRTQTPSIVFRGAWKYEHHEVPGKVPAAVLIAGLKLGPLCQAVLARKT